MLTGCSLTVTLSIPPHSYHGGTGEIFTSRCHFSNGRDHRSTLSEPLYRRIYLIGKWPPNGRVAEAQCLSVLTCSPSAPLALSRRTSRKRRFLPTSSFHFYYLPVDWGAFTSLTVLVPMEDFFYFRKKFLVGWCLGLLEIPLLRWVNYASLGVPGLRYSQRRLALPAPIGIAHPRDVLQCRVS